VELLINPPIDEIRPALLDALNRCFPHWGGDADFQWHFLRTVGGRKSDLMLVRDSGRFVAGSAVVYRPVRFSAGQPAEVGIMASSWTLPEARGHGHFSHVIETSVALARDHGVALLLAYVTSINASARRLLASGAAGYPTHYLIGDGSAPSHSSQPLPQVEELTEAALDDAMRASRAIARVSRFFYAPDEWREQYWMRPCEMRILRVCGLGMALMETKHDFDRLLALSTPGDEGADCLAPLIAWSHARGQKFFAFTTNDAWRDRAVRLGMRHLPGFLTARIGSEAALRQCLPDAAPGELHPGALYDPASPVSIVPWCIQGGDRM
jgi:ribosomal protein S18 acetylase RimI-like enzyme